MRIFNKTKDGGPDSPVDAYFLFEFKRFGSVALLRFNKGSREAYHTHAFNAYTWFLWGNMCEELKGGSRSYYSRSLFPKVTLRSKNHRVIADKTSWCFTIRGPWVSTWTEDLGDTKITLTHGRIIVSETVYPRKE